MPFALPKILSRSNCILILVVSHLASPVPLRSRRRLSISSESEQGFSAAPRVLEIQLPLRIASREDLLAWSRYVTNLVVTRFNRTSAASRDPPRDPPSLATQREKTRLPVANVVSGPNVRPKETSSPSSPGEKRPGLNYPARRLKEPPPPKPDDMVVAYPLPVGDLRLPMSPPLPPDPFGLATPGVPTGPFDQQQLYQGHYAHLNLGEPFRLNAFDVVGNPQVLAQPPAATYLPLSLTTADVAAHPYAIHRNASEFREPARQPSTKNTLNYRAKAAGNVPGRAPSSSDGSAVRNLSRLAEPLLTFPFQAVITITRQPPDATADLPRTRPKDHRNKDRPDEHTLYFPRNFTLANSSGRLDVLLDDLGAETERNRQQIKQNKSRPEDEEVEEEQKDEKQNAKGGQRKSNGKKKKVSGKQQKSNKRQTSILGDLLRMLGLLRKLPKNSTEVSVAGPVLSILKGTNSQKITVAFEEEASSRGRRNQTTHQAQELDDDDDDNGNGDDNDDGDDNGGNDDDDGNKKEKQQEDDDDEEEEGGSVQALLELLPLAAPILEELSDPESDINLVELLQGAIPLLEGLSDPEDDGIDIPGVLVPLSQRLSEGPEGEGSDSGAILGPLIQLIAPLIGPIVGPLIGPLSRTSSGPGGKQGSASLITAVAGPLSEPGANGQSVLSGLIASITAKLSKESSASAGDSDVKSLVSSLVSGVLAGASAGSSGSKGQKDTYYAPTTYGGYGGHSSYGGYGGYGGHYSPPKSDLLSMAAKEILGAFLKLSATSSTSSASLSGASSSSSTGLSASSSDSSKEPPKYPPYGAPPPPYASVPAKPDYYATPELRPPASTDSSYVMFARRQRREQIKKT